MNIGWCPLQRQHTRGWVATAADRARPIERAPLDKWLLVRRGSGDQLMDLPFRRRWHGQAEHF